MTLLDYPLISSDDSNSVSANLFHIRWSEVPFIQVWSQYFCGDYRPPIIITSERGTAEFVNELQLNFNVFKEDNLRVTCLREKKE